MHAQESKSQDLLHSKAELVESLARGLGLVLFVTSLLAIFFAGTFPFDFKVPPSIEAIGRLVWERFDLRWTQYDPNFEDRGENILFFIPFGFTLASILRVKRPGLILISLPASFLMSGLIEVLQSFVSFRDPSLMDLWCNTLGGLAGAIIYIAIGAPLFRLAATILLALHPLAKPVVLAALLVLYAVLQLAAPLMIQNPGNLSSWDSTMPLMVGNELSGDRAWRGSVSRFVLADRAATAAEVAQLAGETRPDSIFKDSLLAHYEIRGKGPYSDLTGHLGALEWVGIHAPLTDEQIPDVGPDQWLQTRQPAAAATNRIGQTSQFTFAVTASTLDFNQRGPARLVSISQGTTNCDIQLGQEFNDLTIRLRTGSRRTPDLYVRNVFSDLNPHHLLVTHKQTQIAIYVDGQSVGNVEITPEAKVIWRLYPRGFRTYIDRYGYRSYAAIYRLLVFIPFAALLGATLITSQLSRSTKRVIALVSTLFVAIALELILGHESASGFQPRNLMISLVVGVGMLGVFALCRRKADLHTGF